VALFAAVALSPLARYRIEQATLAGVAAVAGVAIGVAGALVLSDDDGAPPPAPEIAVSQPEAGDVEIPESAQEIGFPGFATRNTTRIAGRDPVVDAAGAALAAFPTGAGVAGPMQSRSSDPKTGLVPSPPRSSLPIPSVPRS
jgi:hypothetical protein